ncbi:MAG: thioredoxin [Ilumatobacter sp.]|nr:thioredoxin [Ilumatobacter sp.]
MAAAIVACPSCDTKNRVPSVAAGRPRCATCHRDLPWLVDVGDREFDAAVDVERLVLVDLWAAWCGPCRAVAPILATLARDFAGDIKVVKVDVDASPITARRYSATSIPTLLFLRHGELVDRLVGAHPEHVLRERVKTLLAGANEPPS